MAQQAPAPGPLTTIVAASAVVASPVAAALVVVASAFNSGPTTGSALVGLETAAPDGTSEKLAQYGSVVETWDQDVVDAYYLPEVLGHAAVAGAALLVGVVAACVILRRPLSRVVVATLAGFAVFSSVSWFVGPAARTWAAEQVVERERSAASTDLEILPIAEDWYAWHGIFGTLAVVALGAALFVLHLRRQSAVRVA